MGTFHEWNGSYYIDLADWLLEKDGMFERIVRHETRHMIVEYMRDKKIIDLTEHTERIAGGMLLHYNQIFDGSVSILKYKQLNEKL